MKLKLVIFDLDGTLLNTFGDLRSAVNAALLKNGFPHRSLREIKRFVGNGVKKLVERAVPEETGASEREAVYRDFLIAYREKQNETTAPYEGVDALLKFLKNNGVKTAVLSNKLDSAVKELVAELLQGIDCATGETDKIPKKPDPAGVFEILKKCGAEKEETVLVGDSETDADTAENAGLRFAAVLWGARTKSDFDDFRAECYAERVSDLIAWFSEVWGLKY